MLEYVNCSQLIPFSTESSNLREFVTATSTLFLITYYFQLSRDVFKD